MVSVKISSRPPVSGFAGVNSGQNAGVVNHWVMLPLPEYENVAAMRQTGGRAIGPSASLH